MSTKKTVVLLLQGYFIHYDKYDRAKMMFLDDYDDDGKHKFTKSYITQRSNREGYAPISEDKKHFYVKCKKGAVGLIEGKPSRLVPIQELIQHKVECVVKVNDYKFYADGEMKQGWNLRLANIKLLEM